MSLLSRIRRQLPQFADIGQYRIRLPRGSKRNLYQAQFRRYDIALGEIARVIHKAYPSVRAIDVGANVGDTAALIRKHADIPVLCIEGDRRLLPILIANSAQMGSDIEIEPSFVGRDRTFVDEAKIRAGGLNASLVGAIGFVDHGIELRSLETILLRHQKFARAKLLKIDAEGCDFDIIRQSTVFVARAKPAIYFEYAPSYRPDEPNAGPDTIDVLSRQGYSHFLYYDNNGNFLVSVRSDERDRVLELHSYLLANHKYGVVVPYFDICAFHEEDSAIAAEVRGIELLSPEAITAANGEVR